MTSKFLALLAVAAIRAMNPNETASPQPASLHACSADPALSLLVAASDLIVVGSMNVSREALSTGGIQQSPEYLKISVKVSKTLKGQALRPVIVRFYPKDAPYKPSNATVLNSVTGQSILFLEQVDDGPVGLYFAGSTPLALQSASSGIVAGLSAEITRQKEVLRTWQPDRSIRFYQEVHDILGLLGRVRGQQQQHLFDRLEALGPAAVPAIAAQMDDRRPLNDQAISLANHSPDAFESMRYYRPELVVDALDAILNQITGESFGSIVNGGSDRQRAATVAGWRLYATETACRQSVMKG